MSGTASESGGASDNYNLSESMGSSGDWDSTTLSGYVSGGDNAHRCYSGGETYSQDVSGSTAGSGSFAQTIDGLTLDGTMSQSGNDDWTETYSVTDSAGNDMCGPSQSGTDSGTGSGATNFSYSASGSSNSYTDASGWSNASVSAEEDGYHNTSYSEADGWTLASGSWNATSASDSSSASAYDDWQYAASGEWSSATSLGDPNALGDWSYSNAAGNYSDTVQQSTSSAAYQDSDTSTDCWFGTTTTQNSGSETRCTGTADSAFSASDNYGSGTNGTDNVSSNYGQDSQQLATHDEYGYCQTDWSSGNGTPSLPWQSNTTNEASGWTNSDDSSSTSWYAASDGCVTSDGYSYTDDPSSASYDDDPISSPGFDGGAYYSGVGFSAPASVTDPGSIFSDGWYECTPAATSSRRPRDGWTNRVHAPCQSPCRRPGIASRCTHPR
jgi:hypothetical protein